MALLLSISWSTLRRPPHTGGFLERSARVRLNPLPIARVARWGRLELLLLLVCLSVLLKVGNPRTVAPTRLCHWLQLASRILVWKLCPLELWVRWVICMNPHVFPWVIFFPRWLWRIWGGKQLHWPCIILRWLFCTLVLFVAFFFLLLWSLARNILLGMRLWVLSNLRCLSRWWTSEAYQSVHFIKYIQG